MGGNEIEKFHILAYLAYFFKTSYLAATGKHTCPFHSKRSMTVLTIAIAMKTYYVLINHARCTLAYGGIFSGEGEAMSTKGGLVKGVAAWGVPGAEPPGRWRTFQKICKKRNEKFTIFSKIFKKISRFFFKFFRIFWWKLGQKFRNMHL